MGVSDTTEKDWEEHYKEIIMFSVKEADDYMYKMRNVVKTHLNNPDSIYYGLEGHKRLARECGYALNDFDEKGRNEILKASYGIIYVSGCNLKPILNAKEWIEILESGVIR